MRPRGLFTPAINGPKMPGLRIDVSSFMVSVSFLHFLLMSVCPSLAASLFYLPLVVFSNLLWIEKPDKKAFKNWLQTAQFCISLISSEWIAQYLMVWFCGSAFGCSEFFSLTFWFLSIFLEFASWVPERLSLLSPWLSFWEMHIQGHCRSPCPSASLWLEFICFQDPDIFSVTQLFLVY